MATITTTAQGTITVERPVHADELMLVPLTDGEMDEWSFVVENIPATTIHGSMEVPVRGYLVCRDGQQIGVVIGRGTHWHSERRVMDRWGVHDYEFVKVARRPHLGAAAVS